jgi:RNA polymerase sigma-70 factor (ECF subfamily)
MNQPPDKEEFQQLLQRNSRIIFKICHSYCSHKSDMEDLAQEIIYQLWKSYPNYSSTHKFTTWMYRVSLNVAISFYGKDRNKPRRVPLTEEAAFL